MSLCYIQHVQIMDQFCSAAFQHSTKTLLDAVDISVISTEKSLSKNESLEHVYDEIARLCLQCPPEVRSDQMPIAWSFSSRQSVMINGHYQLLNPT
jgi:hypothetical protein